MLRLGGLSFLNFKLLCSYPAPCTICTRITARHSLLSDSVSRRRLRRHVNGGLDDFMQRWTDADGRSRGLVSGRLAGGFKAIAAIEALGGTFALEHTSLVVDDTQVTDAGLEELRAALPECNVVWK
jgi:hypothetical protein